MKVREKVSLYVKKFGGSSVATPQKMINVAKRILSEKKEEDQVVIVVSAMGNTTDELIEFAGTVSKETHGREMDVLLATGEQVSIAMMAMTFISLGVKAVSLTGEQAGIFVEGTYGKSFISGINPKRVFKELKKGNIVIVAGFQGVNKDGNIATLGRGGSDATAVALAGVMKADVCEIYTDVEGVYSADPRFVPGAKKMKEITNMEMLEMARLGAEVMQARSVEIGLQYHIPIHVRSSFSENEGTVIREKYSMNCNTSVIKGVTHDLNVVKVSITGLTKKVDITDFLVNLLNTNNISTDMIIKNDDNGIFFTIKETDLNEAKQIFLNLQEKKCFKNISFESNVVKISVVGLKIKKSYEILKRIINKLNDFKINIHMISENEISTSFLVSKESVKNVVNLIHEEFFK